MSTCWFEAAPGLPTRIAQYIPHIEVRAKGVFHVTKFSTVLRGLWGKPDSKLEEDSRSTKILWGRLQTVEVRS